MDEPWAYVPLLILRSIWSPCTETCKFGCSVKDLTLVMHVFACSHATPATAHTRRHGLDLLTLQAAVGISHEHLQMPIKQQRGTFAQQAFCAIT